MNPLVSVIIPSYNHGRFLKQTITSVLQEERVLLELIIIDDGSSDDSWECIQSFAQADTRVRAFSQSNQGAHAAINRGLALAKGEFLSILNSDDRYSPDRLATLVQLAQTNDLDFIATGLSLIDGDGAPIENHPWLIEYQRMIGRAEQDGLWAALLERNFTVSTSNFFVRRALYEQLGPIRPYRYNMDWDYVLRAYLADPTRFAWRHDLRLWEYRLHGKNTILGGLPVSAIEANYLLLRSLQQHHHIPAAAVAGLRRHYKLIRQQQVAKTATQRDTYWNNELQKTHQQWQLTQNQYETMREAHSQAHARLGQALTDLGEAREAQAAAHRGWEQTHQLLAQTQQQLQTSQHELQASQHELQASQQEIASLLSSRSYRWGRALTAPLRGLRALLRPEPTNSSNTSQTADEPHSMLVKTEDLRIAVHIHLYYVDLLDELLDAVAHIPNSPAVFISTPHDPTKVRAVAEQRLENLTVWQCPNQGKDIGPFIDAIQRFNLPDYDLVLKIHGKKSENAASYMQVIRQLFGQDIQDGDDWRRKLIYPLAGSPEIAQEVLEQFASNSQIGMIGAQQFLCTAPDANPTAYEAVCQRLNIDTSPLFFGGTMFWIRGAALRPFITANFTLEDFNAADQGAVENTLEHQLERVFGALVQSQGLTIVGR